MKEQIKRLFEVKSYRVTQLYRWLWRLKLSKKTVASLTLLVVWVCIFALLVTTVFLPHNQLQSVLGAYTTATTDVDGNVHLASDTVNDTQLYDTATDSTPDVQQQLGIDPNWKNGVTRQSSALKYNGSSSYTSAPYIALNNRSFTIEGWIKLESMAADQMWFAQVDANNDNKALHLRIYTTGKLRFGFYNHDLDSPVGQVTTGIWYHLAYTYNSVSKVRKIYVNGVSVASDILSSDYLGTAGNTTIGGRWNNSEYISGSIDEVQVSNTVRYSSNFSPSRRFVEDANTLGLWHFDEGSGNTAYDSSQYANNGDLTGHAPTWVSGSNAVMATGSENITLGENSSTTNDKAYELKTVPSSGLQFDGTNDYLTGDGAGLPNSGVDANIVLEAWIKPTNIAAGRQTLFGKGASAACFNYRFGIYNAALWASNTNGDYNLGGTITAGVWQHVAVVYTSGLVKGYVNGVYVGESANGTSNCATTNWTISNRASNAATEYFVGSLDEMRISNQPRYTADFTPQRRFSADGMTLALWHFDDGTGTTTADFSGNANTGTLMNGTSNSPAADGTTNGPIWTNGIATNQSIGNSSAGWALPGYQNRQKLNITNNVASTLNTGYGVESTINRGALMDNKQTLGNGNDWRIMYQPQDTRRSLRFDGADDYSSYPDTIQFGSSDFSIASWVYLNGPGGGADGYNFIFSQRVSTVGNGNPTVDLYVNANNQVKFSVRDNVGAAVTSTPSDVLNLNTWYYLTAVKTGSNITIYINAIAKTPTAHTLSGNFSADVVYKFIGKNKYSGTDRSFLNGCLDDPRVFNRALSAGEVSALYNGGTGINAALGGEVAWWKMDEGSGQIVRDYSGNENNGILGADASVASDDPTWSTDGVVSTSQEVPREIPNGHALTFSGTGQYVRQSSQIITSSPFTVDLWYRPVDFAVNRAIFAQGAGATGSKIRIGTDTSGHIRYYLDGTNYSTSATTLSSNTWYHIALTYDVNRNPKAILYVNGAMDATTSNITAEFPANNVTLCGSAETMVHDNCKGLLDEVRVSNDVRYKNNFTTSSVPDVKDSSTLALWHMDDGSGESIADQTGNFSSTITGANWITNGGIVKSINQTQFKTIAPIGASSTDKDYYLYYGNLNEKSAAQSYNSYGLLFDGTDDNINLGQPASLDVDYITVSAWVKYDTSPTTKGVIAGRDNGSARDWCLYNLDALTLRFFIFTGNVSKSKDTAFTPTLNTWYHLVGTYDGSYVRIYINGADQGSPLAATGTIDKDAVASFIGSNSNAVHGHHDGSIDSLRIYNRALTAAEVTALYTNSPYVSNSGLVGWWKLDDGATAAATTATDSSGSGNTGTLTNFNFDQNSNWVTNSSLLHAATEPTVTSLVTEAETPIFYQWRQAGGSWSTRAPIPTTQTQLGSEGVYISFNPNGRYSTNDYYKIASWAVEAFTTSSPQRGKKRAFPNKANIIGNNGGLDIIDAETNKLWMRIPKGTNYLLTNDGCTYIGTKDQQMLNGRLFLVATASCGNTRDVRVLDFGAELSTHNNQYFSGTFADRADALGYAGTSVIPSVDNATSVSVQVLGSPPKEYIAAGRNTTVGRAALIKDSTATPTLIRLGAYNASQDRIKTTLASDGKMYTAVEGVSLERFDNVSAAVDLDVANVIYSTSSTPALRSNAINDISVTLGNSLADYTSNQVALGTDLGVEVIHEHSTQASGYVEHYTSTGSTGTSNYSNKKFGGAILFDGSNDYVTIPTVTGVDTAADHYNTVELWMKWDGAAGTRMVFGWKDIGYDLVIYSNNCFGFNTGAGDCYGIPRTGLENKWVYVTAIFNNGDVTKNSLFVDGVKQTLSQIQGTPTSKNATAKAYLGTWLNTGSFFGGIIDEVRISNFSRYSTSFVPPSAPLSSDANTVGLYHFDERYGGVAGISGQYVYDDSGNNNNGTLGPDATITTADPLRVYPSIAGVDKVTAVGISKSADTGQNLLFNGSTYAHSTNFSPPTSGQTYTAWIKTTSVSGGIGGFSDNSPSSVNYDRELYLSGGNLKFYITNAAASLSSTATSTSAVNDNNWHFVVGVATGSTTYVSIDGGAPQGNTGTPYTGYTGYTTARYNMGNTSSGKGGYFTGSIDDIRIYNRALSGSEIAALYNGGLGTTTVSLSGNVGWWRMNEGSGNTVTDFASTPHNGDLTGHAPTWSTGSPVKEQSALWVGTNGAGADDGAVTAISLATGRQITSYTASSTTLPDNDVTSLSLGANGGLALVGTEAGAWPAGMAGFVVEDQVTASAGADSHATIKGGTVRVKGGQVRVR